MSQVTISDALATEQAVIEEFFRQTKADLLALQNNNPRHDAESWYEQTRKFQERFEHLFSWSEMDEMRWLDSDTPLGKGLAALIALRDQIGYYFELCWWAPEEVARHDWSATNQQLEHIHSLIEEAPDLQWSSCATRDLTAPSEIVEDIKEAYLDPSTAGLPWIVGVSWGKDSTLLLKLVCLALEQIPPEKRTRPVYVTTVDTLVEVPVVLHHIRTNVQDLREYARARGLPITVHVATPEMDDRYYVCVLGKGYLPPKPGNINRFCTDRLKIRPNARLVRQLSDKAILLLGTRYSESAARAESMRKWEGEGRYGKTVFKGIFSYTPIARLTTEVVWGALSSGGLPWGNGFPLLKKLYRESSGECPLVRDASTPAGCGSGGRWGCTVCTIIGRDKTMTNLAATYPWLEPLLEYRDILARIGDDPTMREPFPRDRRTGRRISRPKNRITKAVREGKRKPWAPGENLGGLNLTARQYLLEALLETQKKVLEGLTEEGLEITGGYCLISPEEIHRIKSWWAHMDGYAEPGFVPERIAQDSHLLQESLF